MLRDVDLIACEDTRRTRALLSHFDIHTPTVSYYEHNKLARGPQILRRLTEGASVAARHERLAPSTAAASESPRSPCAHQPTLCAIVPDERMIPPERSPPSHERQSRTDNPSGCRSPSLSEGRCRTRR